jgi:glucokinase
MSRRPTTATLSSTNAASRDAYPWLVADIGGTNARFGLVRAPGERVHDVRTVKCAEFASPQDAARSYLDAIRKRDGIAPQPRHAAFALASAISGDNVKLTNNAWTVSRSAAERGLGVQRVHLYNDFEALALALPHLTSNDVMPIGAVGSDALDSAKSMAVIGPGTGLGVAGCVPNGHGGWAALAGEGGHVTISAADDFECDVLRVVRREFEHVSGERILSGIGLPVLHRAVVSVLGGAAEDLLAETITQRALDGDVHCERTLDAFCAMLGGFAGNVALTLGARGGVFVAGGDGLQIGAEVKHSRFRERFESKGRFCAYLKPIATCLITAPHAALAGAAQGIANEITGR